VGLEVYPDFNVFEVARPYANRLILERYRPDRIADRVVGDVARYGEALSEAPFQISELLEELRDGELEIRVRSDRLPVAIDKVQSAMNRVALALVAFALLLGSAVISAFVDGGPQIWGASLAGLPALLAGLGVTAWLFLGIARSGRW
jgi:ubiquinone biosynthesis protein